MSGNITWTTDTAAAVITDSTDIGLIESAYQLAWRVEGGGAKGALGPAGWCSAASNKKGLEAAQAVAAFINQYSAMAASSLHHVPVYNSELFDPDNVPDDPGVDNAGVAIKFKMRIPGFTKAYPTSVFIPAAILNDADTTNFIGTELEAMFNGRAQVGTSGQPGYVAPYTKLLPTGYSCRFVGATPTKAKN